MDRRALLLALPLALGCTVQAPSVALTTICGPPSDAAACVYAATCGTQYIGTVAVDSRQANQLFLAIEAANQSKANGDTSSGHVNTADAFLQEIAITYSGPVAIPAVTRRLYQKVPASGTSVVAFAVVDVDATTIQANTRTTIVAKVKGKGVFGDGTDFETPEIEIPVVVSSDGWLGEYCATGSVPTATCPAPMLSANPNRVSQAPNGFTCP